jgi:hypothetical protein
MAPTTTAHRLSHKLIAWCVHEDHYKYPSQSLPLCIYIYRIYIYRERESIIVNRYIYIYIWYTHFSCGKAKKNNPFGDGAGEDFHPTDWAAHLRQGETWALRMTHGKNLQSGYFWQFYGRFLVVFWYSDTVYLWYIYGIFMVYLWYLFGRFLVCPYFFDLFVVFDFIPWRECLDANGQWDSHGWRVPWHFTPFVPICHL